MNDKKQYLSYSLDIVKARDGRLMFDLVNDACDTHNIFDGDKLVESTKEWNIRYNGVENNNDPEYEFVDMTSPEAPNMTTEEWDILRLHYRRLLCGDNWTDDEITGAKIRLAVGMAKRFKMPLDFAFGILTDKEKAVYEANKEMYDKCEPLNV